MRFLRIRNKGWRQWLRVGGLPLAAVLAVILAPGLALAQQNLYVPPNSPYNFPGNAIWDNEYIGFQGTGVLNQGNYSNTVHYNLTVGVNSGNHGTYNLSGGTLSVGGSGGDEIIGASGSGLFAQTGGTNSIAAGRTLSIGDATGGDGTYTLSGSYSILTGTVEYVGNSGTGAFNQSNGTSTMTNVTLGNNAGSNGTYTLSGGSLAVSAGSAGSTNHEYIGNSGSGSFTQTGGTHTVGLTGNSNAHSGTLSMAVSAGSSGTYDLQSGSLTVLGSEIVGGSGIATFAQSGGTNTLGYLHLGNNAGGSGTYTLGGGTGSPVLTADSETVGESGGSGIFTQSGGTNTIGNPLTHGSGTLTLGTGSGSSGTYTLGGGTGSPVLSAYSETVGASGGSGTFTQLGGTNTISYNGQAGGNGILTLAASAGSSGAYDLQGGSLTAVTVNVNDGGTFTQAGGSLSASLVNQGIFTYNGGTFNGRLQNYGTVNFNADFTAGNGLANYTDMTVGGRTLTLNGQGLDKSGNLSLLAGGILAGAGPKINEAGSLIFLQGGSITGSGALDNHEGGLIFGQGTISSPFNNSAGELAVTSGTSSVSQSFSNGGLVSLNSSAAVLSGGTLTNTGTVIGKGTINNNIANTGIIQPLKGTLNLAGAVTNGAGGLMTAASGATLRMTAGLAANAGTINLTGGTFDNNGHPLTNNGQISGYGTFSVGGLSNKSTVTLTGGPATVNGPVTNEAGSQLYITANSASFAGPVTNYGTVKTTSATVTWAGGFTNSGAYISDPATQYFTDLTILANGYLQGGKGDTFSVSGDFMDQSTQTLWNTALANLIFTGGGAHQFAFSGTNLAWGSLDLTDQILNLKDGDSTPGGAFHVGQILGLAFVDGQITNITGAPNLTIYYDPNLNHDLHGIYTLDGGGTLNPGTVPVPASAWLFLTGLTGLGLLGRRRKGKTS